MDANMQNEVSTVVTKNFSYHSNEQLGKGLARMQTPEDEKADLQKRTADVKRRELGVFEREIQAKAREDDLKRKEEEIEQRTQQLLDHDRHVMQIKRELSGLYRAIRQNGATQERAIQGNRIRDNFLDAAFANEAKFTELLGRPPTWKDISGAYKLIIDDIAYSEVGPADLPEDYANRAMRRVASHGPPNPHAITTPSNTLTDRENTDSNTAQSASASNFTSVDDDLHEFFDGETYWVVRTARERELAMQDSSPPPTFVNRSHHALPNFPHDRITARRSRPINGYYPGCGNNGWEG